MVHCLPVNLCHYSTNTHRKKVCWLVTETHFQFHRLFQLNFLSEKHLSWWHVFPSTSSTSVCVLFEHVAKETAVSNELCELWMSAVSTYMARLGCLWQTPLLMKLCTFLILCLIFKIKKNLISFFQWMKLCDHVSSSVHYLTNTFTLEISF